MERLNSLERQWLAVYTRPNCEKKVVLLLQQQGVETYCPLIKTVRQWSDRKKKLQLPLIPSYVFVRVSELDRKKILHVPGILNFVFWLGKPAVIREYEINEMKQFLNEFSTINVCNLPIAIGDQVRVTYGSFKDFKGQVVDRKKGKVILLIEQLGIELRAELAEDKVAP